MRWLLTPLAVSTKNGDPAEKNRVSLTINDDRADEIMHDRGALYAAFMRRVSIRAASAIRHRFTATTSTPARSCARFTRSHPTSPSPFRGQAVSSAPATRE